ncbi:MAG TPA: AAA family ATPase [Nitrososphaeraceae archaeon]|nr:AAA family ATPase [Nitrososphaeraceae archaeon]
MSVILDSFWWRFLIAGGGYISTLIGNKSGLLDDIYGFEDVKDLFKMAIQAERPVHLLLCGPPASAKSLFMRSLTKLERSYYAVGSSSTKSGIFDYLFEHRPRYFIVDELEKMNKKDQTSLLNLMESGILSELKHKQMRTTQLKTWVFASCNSTDKLLPPLLTRFKDIHFKPYTEEEFVEIVVNVLDREEGIDRDIAIIIADGVFNRLKSSNIRECVRIARLAKNDCAQVNRIIDTFAKYGNDKQNVFLK